MLKNLHKLILYLLTALNMQINIANKNNVNVFKLNCDFFMLIFYEICFWFTQVAKNKESQGGGAKKITLYKVITLTSTFYFLNVYIAAYFHYKLNNIMGSLN